nr:MAG TPA: hypothetical protein [Caudoviricetes sp.]
MDWLVYNGLGCGSYIYATIFTMLLIPCILQSL